ncbi:MAG: PEFG-CTERM sorting domain-containing protein, partial [Nitrosopumilaceae archaeon]
LLMIITLLSLLPYATAQQPTRGDQWNSLNNLLKESETAENIDIALDKLQQARSIYVDVFKSAAQELDQESDDLIEDAFVQIEQKLKDGNIVEAGLYRQVVDKTIYKIAFMKIEQALDQKDTHSLMDWITVIEKKFKISAKSSFVTNSALIEIQESPDKIMVYSDTIKEELLSLFKLKTIEELEEAIAALNEGKINDARKFAFEGLYYYRTLHPSIEERLGTETASELLGEMEEVVEVTGSNLSAEQMKEEVEHIFSEVELIIREYEGGDTSEIGLAISGIKDRLVLVDEEYKDAVSNGQITNQAEYDETVVFLAKATEIFNENKNTFLDLSESDTSLIESNLSEMDEIIQSFGEYSAIKSLVGETIVAIDDLARLSGGLVEIGPLAYIEKIEGLLDQVSTSYRNGDSDTALTLATAAYLDNYEFIEADIAYHDRELMEKIEIMLREELRNMIKNGESSEVVDRHVDAIKQELEIAEAVVPEFGSLVIMVFLTAIITIVVVSIKNPKLSLTPRL